MKPHKDLWKIGVEPVCDRGLEVDRPLYEGATLIDLLTGARYAVQTLYRARRDEKFASTMPDDAIQTWRSGHLPEQDLTKLRERFGYTRDESCQPFSNIVFEM